MATVITSLNPNIRRLDVHGCDIGVQYQHRCVESWHHAGARVISVNTREEIARLAPLNYPVHFTTVEPRPFMPGGRPLPSISDALSVAKGVSNDVVLLVNSDIMLSAGRDRLSTIQGLLEKDSFLFSSRLDVEAVGASSGQIYPYGYDVFAFHASKAWDLEAGAFTFGSPWWDYWLPMAALFGGLELTFLEGSDFHHLVHDQAWSWPAWNFGFALFIQKLQSRLTPSGRFDTAGDFGSGFANFLLTETLDDIQRRIASDAAAPHGLGMEMSKFVRSVLNWQSRKLQ